MSFEEAREAIKSEYEMVGPQRAEWYDVSFWFRQFSLADYRPVLNSYRHLINYYPEAEETLAGLQPRLSFGDFVRVKPEVPRPTPCGGDRHFRDVFSCISDYRLLKTPEFYGTICRELKVRPHEVVHVGDNWESDYLAARSAGMRAFYLEPDWRKAGRRRSEGPFRVQAPSSELVTSCARSNFIPSRAAMTFTPVACDNFSATSHGGRATSSCRSD